MLASTVHIATAFDKGYLKPFTAMLNSVMTNNTPGQLHFHVIATGVNQSSLTAIAKWIESLRNKITFYSIDEKAVTSFVLTGPWSHAVYYRLYFPKLVNKEVSRLLYIDCDTIVLKSLNDLYQTNLENKPVGAVWDNYVGTQELIGIFREGEYFNSGLLLIDLARWNDLSISEHAITYLNKYPERIRFVDQCALNAVLKGQWQSLPNRFNLLYSFVPNPVTNVQVADLIATTTMVHYTLDRPWHMLCKNRLRSLYRKYYRAAPVRHGRVIDDFSMSKIPAWLKLRLVEFYVDNNWLQNLWRAVK